MTRRTGQTVMIAAGKGQDSRKLHHVKALTVCSVHGDLSGFPPKMDLYTVITVLTHVTPHQKSLTNLVGASLQNSRSLPAIALLF